MKEPGFPTFFMTFSSIDLQQNELMSIISKSNKLNLQEEDIEKIICPNRCKMLNNKPALVERDFLYRT